MDYTDASSGSICHVRAAVGDGSAQCCGVDHFRSRADLVDELAVASDMASMGEALARTVQPASGPLQGAH